jgi:DNA-binding response OmpR family regulator
LGMADQIKANPGDWFSEGLQMIKRNGKNLLYLVNQMLDLSKLEAGRLPLQLIQGEIIGYLKYLFDSFHSLAESKGIVLQFNSDHESLMMDYDPDKLLNIIFNLVSNAIKFTPPGGTITMSLKLKHESEKQLQIKIQDTGIGMSEEDLPHIFDRFYKIADENKTIGTGIGLAIVKELINLMKWRVLVKSEEGKGTEFTLFVPVTHNAALSEVEPLRDLKEPLPFELPSQAVQQAGKNIAEEEKPLLLIVEDNVDVVTYLSSFLKQDYELLLAYDGAEGIEQAIKNIPDIILSDVMMPEKDGFELCQTLKANEQTSHIPIILLTAKADTVSRFEGIELGADAYLSKPVNPKELELRLRKLLELRKQLQEYYSKKYFGPRTGVLHTREDAFMDKLFELMNAHLSDENYDIKLLCKDLFISRMQLHRKLKALTGKSTSHYLRLLRLQKAKELLLSTDKNISEIAYDVGFNSPTYFSTSFLEEYNQSPMAFRNKS